MFDICDIEKRKNVKKNHFLRIWWRMGQIGIKFTYAAINWNYSVFLVLPNRYFIDIWTGFTKPLVPLVCNVNMGPRFTIFFIFSQKCTNKFGIWGTLWSTILKYQNLEWAFSHQKNIEFTVPELCHTNFQCTRTNIRPPNPLPIDIRPPPHLP